MRTTFTDQQKIKQLPKIRGSYFYVQIDATIIAEFADQRKTRLICTLENDLSFRCGLNHLGDGNFFIILNRKNLKQVNKQLGDEVHFHLEVDPDPLGVSIPEVLQVLLTQDESLRKMYDSLSMGKKRHVIHSIKKIKDIDRQVLKAEEMIRTHYRPKRRS